MLNIPKRIKNEMVFQAKKDSPIETCGYLAGNGDEVKEIIPMTNVDQSPEHFSFDPTEQFQALKASRQKGLELISVYHSHPASPARLSQEDLRLANDPKITYLIVSLLNAEPEFKAFRVINREISEVTISILEGAEHE